MPVCSRHVPNPVHFTPDSHPESGKKRKIFALNIHSFIRKKRVFGPKTSISAYIHATTRVYLNFSRPRGVYKTSRRRYNTCSSLLIDKSIPNVSAKRHAFSITLRQRDTGDENAGKQKQCLALYSKSNCLLTTTYVRE